MDSTTKATFLTLLATTVVACGGSGSNDNESDFGPISEFEFSPGGIWQAQLEFDLFSSGHIALDPEVLPADFVSVAFTGEVFSPPTEENLFLIDLLGSAKFFITESGEFYFSQSDSFGISYGKGQITRSDSRGVAGRFVAQTFPFEEIEGGIFPGFTIGEKHTGDCEISGTLTEYSLMYLTTSCDYGDELEHTSTLDLLPVEDCSSGVCLVASSSYQSPLSFSDIAGNYEGALMATFLLESEPPTEQLEIFPSGEISGTIGSGVGCDFDGQISIAKDGFNLYDTEWMLSNCEVEELNGLEIQGLTAVRQFGENIYLDLIAEFVSSEDPGLQFFSSRYHKTEVD